MSDSEKKQRKALVDSASLEIFILEHLREYGADTRDVMAAIQEAKEGKFQKLQRLFECPSLSHNKQLG